MSIKTALKQTLKRSAQHVAARMGPHTRKSREPQLLVLMYHRILPADDKRARLEEPGMLVTPESFAAHLKILSSYFEFVNLADWLDRRANGLHLPARACAITFDDGWADNYDYAFPVLQSLQVPATIFVVAEMIGTDRLFWPEKLAWLVDTIARNFSEQWANPALEWITQLPADYVFGTTPPTNEQITQFIAYAKLNSDDTNHRYIQESVKSLGLHFPSTRHELLDWQQVKDMLKSGLIDIGSHTCGHIRLQKGISNTVLRHEIVTSKNMIEKHTNQPVKTFCFPNGDYSQDALALVKEHYSGAVTTASGWNDINTDNYLLQRIGIHEDIAADRTSFLARVSGWI